LFVYFGYSGHCWLDALEVAQNQGYSIQKDKKGMYVSPLAVSKFQRKPGVKG